MPRLDETAPRRLRTDAASATSMRPAMAMTNLYRESLHPRHAGAAHSSLDQLSMAGSSAWPYAGSGALSSQGGCGEVAPAACAAVEPSSTSAAAAKCTH